MCSPTHATIMSTCSHVITLFFFHLYFSAYAKHRYICDREGRDGEVGKRKGREKKERTAKEGVMMKEKGRERGEKEEKREGWVCCRGYQRRVELQSTRKKERKKTWYKAAMRIQTRKVHTYTAKAIIAPRTHVYRSSNLVVHVAPAWVTYVNEVKKQKFENILWVWALAGTGLVQGSWKKRYQYKNHCICRFLSSCHSIRATHSYSDRMRHP